MKNKVFISTSSFAKFDSRPLDMLTENGYAVALNPHGRKMTPQELTALAGEAVGLIAGTERLDAEVLGQLSAMQVISRCGAGMDNVDQEAAAARSIKVFNTPDAPTLAVAELTIGLILNVLRQVSVMDRDIRAGTWHKRMGALLAEKTVGVIGFGRIGQKVAALLSAFGCRVVFFDPQIRAHPAGESQTLEGLLAESDIVTLHVSTSQQILGPAELALLKNGAAVVNVARGGNIDEQALYQGLKAGTIGAAALDVFEDEPYQGPLTELENVVLTAHVGSYAREARVKMEIQSVHNLLEGLKC